MARYGRTTAKYGDTWATLAKRSSVDVSSLVKANRAIKPIAGMIIKVPQNIKPQVSLVGPSLPGTPGGTGNSSGVGNAGKGYKKTEKGYQYQYNKTGRDHEQGAWLPTTQYDAWRNEPDDYFAYNGRSWYGAKGKPQGPQWKPGKTPLPFSGNPPPNWATDYKYMLDPEKGTYYYWDTYDWAWKTNARVGKGGGGKGGASPKQTPQPNTVPQSSYTRNTSQYPEAGGEMNYGNTANNTRRPYFTGPGNAAMGNYGAAPGSGQQQMPSYIGLINWRF